MRHEAPRQWWTALFPTSESALQSGAIILDSSSSKDNMTQLLANRSTAGNIHVSDSLFRCLGRDCIVEKRRKTSEERLAQKE